MNDADAKLVQRMRGRAGPFTAGVGERYVDADMALLYAREYGEARVTAERTLHGKHQENSTEQGGPRKYEDVLKPFLALMESELHANAGKGDDWRTMPKAIGMLEIYYHAAKLQKAIKDDDMPHIREYAADVANMAMMLLDVCGGLNVSPDERR